MNDFDLADAISTIIISYRHDEKIAPLDRNHVLKWVNQFDEEDRHIILEETFRILKDQYYSRERIKEILNRWIEKLLNKFNTFDNIIFTNTQGHIQCLSPAKKYTHPVPVPGKKI